MEQQLAIDVQNLGKTYSNGFHALSGVTLQVDKGEVFALLGPNGAGKTTLISIICGIVTATSGTALVNGNDVVKDFRKTRRDIGLVPQELTLGAFETVWETVSFTRGLFGLSPNADYIEKVLKDLSLWEKKDHKIMMLSGGMKRRVLIAKALSHEPKILFLDEPTAGVDVELRKGMWQNIRQLRKNGVTVILTTHYIEEAEEMADRIGIINHGKLILTDDKDRLIKKLGRKELHLVLQEQLSKIPSPLSSFNLELLENGRRLKYSYVAESGDCNVKELFKQLDNIGLEFDDVHTRESSLEEIFVSLVNQK